MKLHFSGKPLMIAKIEKNPSAPYADTLIYLLPEEEDIPLKTALSMAGSK